MRSAMLAVLLASSYATAGIVTSSTINNASVGFVQGPDTMEMNALAFSFDENWSRGEIWFTDTFALFGVFSGTIKVDFNSVVTSFDSFTQFRVVIGPVIDGFLDVFQSRTLEIPFVHGLQMPIEMDMLVFSLDLVPEDTSIGAASVVARMILSNFRVFDAQGVETTDFIYTTASGDPLPFKGLFVERPILVPEPATWLLSAIGMALIARRRRAGLEGITGKKAVNSDTMSVAN